MRSTAQPQDRTRLFDRVDTREQHTRTLEMVRRNVLPKAQADTAKSQLASAEAGVRSAQSKVDRIPVRIELAEAIDTLPTRVGGRANIII